MRYTDNKSGIAICDMREEYKSLLDVCTAGEVKL